MSNSPGGFSTASQENWRRRVKAEYASFAQWETNWGFLKVNLVEGTIQSVPEPSDNIGCVSMNTPLTKTFEVCCPVLRGYQLGTSWYGS